MALTAEARGWTIEEARSSREAADAVGRVAAKLAAERPEVFVGSVVSDDPLGSPMLLVKGLADQFVFDLIAKEEVKINVLDRQPFSFSELQERKSKVHRALQSAGYNDLATSAGIQNAGAVRVVVSKHPNLPSSESSILAFLPEEVRDSTDVFVSEGPVAVNESNRAFGGMRVADGGWDECTSGWSLEVYTWGAALPYFVTTAAHCEGIDGIRQPGVGIHSFPFYSEYLSYFGDVEIHTTNVDIKPWFYGSDTEIRTVLSWEPFPDISVGETICFYSRVQGHRDCSARVQNIWMYCGNSVNMTVMDTHITTGGDSGGGWFWANKAYGSHGGYCDGRSSFMSVDFIDEALNPTLPPGFFVRLYLAN